MAILSKGLRVFSPVFWREKKKFSPVFFSHLFSRLFWNFNINTMLWRRTVHKSWRFDFSEHNFPKKVAKKELFQKNLNNSWTARTIALKNLNCEKFVFILSKWLFVTSLKALFSNIYRQMASHISMMLSKQQKNDQHQLPFKKS